LKTEGNSQNRALGPVGAFKALRNWIAYGVASSFANPVEITGSRRIDWREAQQPSRPGFLARWHGALRIPVHAPPPVMPPAPATIHDGNAGGFPLEAQLPSHLAYVVQIPAAIGHGEHGAIIDARGLAVPELLDMPPGQVPLGFPKDRPVFLSGTVAALSCTKNYYHWLLKMLPRLHLLEAAGIPLDSVERFLINKPSWQQEQVYRDLGIWERCVILDSRTYAVCRVLTAPSLAHDAPVWACEYVRALFGPKPAPESSRKIYVLRGETARRRILNETEICALFQERGFEIVDCSNLSVTEQARLFAESQFVAGAHGAALSNLIFCRAGSSVLEIFATPQNQKTYWLISHHMQLHYHYMMADAAGEGNVADMTVDLSLLKRSLDNLLSPQRSVAMQ
jgi:hypothetical protein